MRPGLDHQKERNMILYIAGGMRGYEEYNFPAFDKAQVAIEKMGHIAISPAAHDRLSGFNEKSDKVTVAYLREALSWDLSQVCRADGVVLLAGWHSSKGARAEVAAARAIGIPCFILVHRTGQEPTLREAHHV